MPLSELRPDFVNQVSQLRNKVLHRVKPKSLNGKHLSGAMLATLAESYVHAINKGAVPSIDSAWTYICKQESQKAMEAAIMLGETELKEIVIPDDERSVKEQIKVIKRKVIAEFRRKNIGEGEQ